MRDEQRSTCRLFCESLAVPRLFVNTDFDILIWALIFVSSPILTLIINLTVRNMILLLVFTKCVLVAWIATLKAACRSLIPSFCRYYLPYVALYLPIPFLGLWVASIFIISWFLFTSYAFSQSAHLILASVFRLIFYLRHSNFLFFHTFWLYRIKVGLDES